MDLNANFDERAAVHSDREPWVASPMKGVDRRMLDRIGDKVARATTIVRYAPGSAFSAHTHTGGEEFLVLEGVFQDEHGDFPVGTYVRNPPTSAHTPSSASGAVIFVKLWQFDMEDRQQITIDTTTQPPQPVQEGVSEIPLFEDARERVRIELWEANVAVAQAGHNGFEALVIEGRFREGDEDFGVNSWLRLPPHTPLNAVSGPDGARLWVKSGHLAVTPTAPNAGG
ncbi:cupin domain-containing protein [Phaeobacter sp. J2-8]|uniref:cupin domain-containing protein n=1 Tax=Phaeobacter sp. J2-8 TaxID=2931394 RepID=UPI001FD507CC|nr:cupin domain-containing protein [Phaeobacter sp. J2-8]MCJ7871172.1 cupin domain-containing protein [Phaeobacter sp. J2-8]